jgi:hypothetical protein
MTIKTNRQQLVCRVPRYNWVIDIRADDNSNMNTKITTVLAMIAIISAVTVIGAISQVAHAGPGNCPKCGNPHSSDPDDITKTNPQGKSVGNPHDSDEGHTTGNPHLGD